MKRYKNIAFVCLAFVVASGIGCKKYLTIEPVSAIGIQEAFSSVNNATISLLGVYDELQGDNGYGIRINLYYPYDTDEGMVSGGLDNGRRGIGRYQNLLTNSELNNPFNQLYRGVEKANLAIEQIPKMQQYTNGTAAEQKDLRRLHGEALTLRAQFYFELIRNWGDVPAPMTPSYTNTNLYTQRANRDSTYDKLLADLAIAKDLVPWRTEVPRNERITKGAVKALRAKLALFRGGYSLRNESKTMERRPDYLTYYQIARDECAELMDRRDQHTLNPSFENIWRNVSSFTYDPFGEILFEVGAGGGNSNSDSRMGNYNGPSVNGASRFGPGGGGIMALPIYFYSFDSIDTRRDVTVTTYQINADNRKAGRALTALTDGKYRRDWRVPALPGSALNLGYNWVMIRFSDVLLMYAEAVNEINGGPTAAATAAFTEVRRRAFRGNESRIGAIPTDKGGFFNAIVNERYLEFGFEAIRKYDLIRWNLLAAKMLPNTGEVRSRLRELRDNPNLPQYMYWRNPAGSEDIEWYGSFYTPTQTPPSTTGWTRVNWREDLIRTNNTLNVGATSVHYIDAIGYFFTPNKSELFPFTQTTLDAYRQQLVQNPGY
ncbi:RagB/SusD family nutrient uptake outer membrane protein [Segetibacter sp. 3557_3]|uniref:RagB/SusD family nutrient uptake outer membrane protein n=1 Tax=Segetibacter sp. 3557_3 TaxID=2547429 RepID=UPI0010589A64|nr:RagB/SusD family nutrient uptake outer membrane protein [Segetibacter sp. 3557_3]TDH27765.1 RagB/SusD family nutrient uptake outer membrane protein [Segetibacter sp. 3557_3]